MKSVDEPESPNFSLDGRTIAFSAHARRHPRHLHGELDNAEIVNLTTDDFFDYGPVYSPDGKFLVYTARVSGNQKLFRLDLDTKKKKQLTFGTNDETPAQFVDDHTLVFSSTADDPSVAIDPETAKNGNIYNLWTLDLSNGELKQFTDALGGVLSPIVLKDSAGEPNRLCQLLQGRFQRSHARAQGTDPHGGERRLRRARPDHRLPGAAAAHARRRQFAAEEVVREDVPRGTATGERRRHQQRRRLRRHRDQLRRRARRQAGEPVRIVDRPVPHALAQLRQPGAAVPVRAAGVLADAVLLRPARRGLLRSVARAAHQPRLARSRRAPFAAAARSASIRSIAIRRLEVSGGLVNSAGAVQRSVPAGTTPQQYQQQRFGQQVFRNGTLLPFSVAFVQETTVFREFGPLAGSTMRLAYDVAPKIGNTLSRQTFDADARYYQRLASSGVLALRLRGFKSIGAFPDFLYFGGNSEMRGYDYLPVRRPERRRSRTPNCAFRSSRPRSRRLASSAASAACSSPTWAAAGSTTRTSSSRRRRPKRPRSIVDYQRDATGAISARPDDASADRRCTARQDRSAGSG